MPTPRVYVETTIVSYLTAWPSRDLVMAGRQQVTRDWWNNRRHRFDLFISQVVVHEASAGDANAARLRLDAIKGIPLLDVTEEVEALAPILIGPSLLPPNAIDDAAHLATAAIHKMDFLLTWNLRHLANAQVAREAYNVIRRYGYEPPTICTPEALEGYNDDL